MSSSLSEKIVRVLWVVLKADLSDCQPAIAVNCEFDQKLHFWKALVITFQMIYNLSGFVKVKIFPLILVITSLRR